MKLLELGGIVFSSISLRKAASPFLDQLEARINHTVLIAILEGGELVYIDKREGDEPIRLTSEIGKRRPPFFGMLGKTLMAYLPEKEIEELLRRYPLEKVAPRSITDPKRFKRSLKEIRERGHAYEYSEAPRSKLRGIRNKTKRNCAGAGYPPSPRLRRGHLALRPHSKLWGIRAEASEAVEGVIGIAAPVRNHLRKVVAAIGTAFPAFSVDDRRIKEIIHLVTETAQEISLSLGFIERSKEEGRKEVGSGVKSYKL